MMWWMNQGRLPPQRDDERTLDDYYLNRNAERTLDDYYLNSNAERILGDFYLNSIAERTNRQLKSQKRTFEKNLEWN